MKWVEGHVLLFFILLCGFPHRPGFSPEESLWLFFGGHRVKGKTVSTWGHCLPEDKSTSVWFGSCFGKISQWGNLPVHVWFWFLFICWCIHIHSLSHRHIHSLTLTHSPTHLLLTHTSLTHSLIHSNPPFLPSSRIVFLLFCVDIFLDLTLWVFSCLGQAVSRVILLKPACLQISPHTHTHTRACLHHACPSPLPGFILPEPPRQSEDPQELFLWPRDQPTNKKPPKTILPSNKSKGVAPKLQPMVWFST